MLTDCRPPNRKTVGEDGIQFGENNTAKGRSRYLEPVAGEYSVERHNRTLKLSVNVLYVRLPGQSTVEDNSEVRVLVCFAQSRALQEK